MFLTEKPTKQATILVVDDTPDYLQVLFQYLRKAGYRVLIAQDGELGIETAKSMTPNLIILDAIMSKMDGLQVCRYLKTNNTTKNIPIIFIAALNDTELKLKAFELGGIDFITMPIGRDELLARIKTHLTIQNLNQSLTSTVDKEQLLFDISDRIRQSLDLKSIFQTTTNEILKSLKCDRVSLVRLQNLQINIESESITTGLENNLYPITFDDLYRERKEYRNYLQAQCANDDFNRRENLCRLKQSSRQPKILGEMPSSMQRKARLIVPIWLDRKMSSDETYSDRYLWGWTILDRFQHSRQWQPSEIYLMNRLTTQLAIAIKQGLLYQQVQNKNQKLKEFAWHDSLTRVFNRRYFDRQLNLEWSKLKRTNSNLSIIMCDVDCFKLYNDTYGHQQGDRCLQLVAKALSSTLKRSGDTLARYGGEEFIVILPNTSIEGAIKVAEAMRAKVKALKLPHTNSSVNSVVTISLGVANTIPDAQNNPSLLVQAVDRALYTAKQRGRDCLAVDRSNIAEVKMQQNQEFHWNKRIRHALAENLFTLYAQPIAALNLDDRKQHFEILLRLTDQGDRVIAPNDFLEVAERNCLMPNIDTWVVDNLLATLNEFDSKDWNNYHFSINLSGASLNHEGFLDYLFAKLSNYHLPPSIFCFEITENIAISNLTKVSNFIESLKNIGCSFALDDFGKGMSSLTYLKNLPVDYLKIDGSFIKELNNDDVSRAMVEAIHHLAGAMGLKTIAEFVEDRSILDTLQDLKVDYAQGYYFGRPEKLTDLVISQ
jgi:diguanylate cyclase (GGDEF)-like protein